MRTGSERFAAVHVGLLWCCGALTRPIQYRGLHRCAVLLSRAFGSRPATTVVKLRDGGRLMVSPSDPYWASLIAPGWTYEPELAALVERAMQCDDVTFMDLGANIGYWTVVAHVAGASHSVAVEASPAVWQLLTENVSLNGITAVVHPPTAVWSTTGDLIEIRSEPLHHEGGSVLRYRDDDADERYFSATVPTVTIDDLTLTSPLGPILIKMDLEGAEIEAVKGAKRTLAERDVVIAYEDHGQDRSSATTACMLSLGLEVRLLADRGTLVPIRSSEQATSFKKLDWKGYNFVAFHPESDLARQIGVSVP